MLREKYYKINKNGCWLWFGARDTKGYAKMWSTKYKGNWMAHRIFYEEKFGKIKDKMQLDHLCRIKNCVNPDHMEVVTNKENCRRRIDLKLNMDKAKSIREMYKNSESSCSKIADKFNVTKGNIYHIINNLIWI